MIALAGGCIEFLIILFVGMYLTNLYIFRKDKYKRKKAWKDIVPFIRTAIAIIGPLIIACIIIGIF